MGDYYKEEGREGGGSGMAAFLDANGRTRLAAPAPQHRRRVRSIVIAVCRVPTLPGPQASTLGDVGGIGSEEGTSIQYHYDLSCGEATTYLFSKPQQTLWVCPLRHLVSDSCLAVCETSRAHRPDGRHF